MKVPGALKKRIAGIPVGVWFVLGAGAVGVGLYLRSRQAEEVEEEDLPELGEEETYYGSEDYEGEGAYYGVDPLTGGGPAPSAGGGGDVGVGGGAEIRIIVDDQTQNGGGTGGTGSGRCGPGQRWNRKKKRCQRVQGSGGGSTAPTPAPAPGPGVCPRGSRWDPLSMSCRPAGVPSVPPAPGPAGPLPRPAPAPGAKDPRPVPRPAIHALKGRHPNPRPKDRSPQQGRRR